jgi:hypothetical protein
MLNALVITFCRMVIILVFVISIIGKVSDLPAFQTAIINFKILPAQWSKIATWMFLIGEISVIALVTWGGNLLLAGFVGATFLLTIFSIALGMTLIRRQQIPCNCFGREEKPISPYDLVRNAGFLVCSFAGIVMLWITSISIMIPDLANILLADLMGVTFVMIMTNLSEIVQLYNQPAKPG